MSQELVSTFLYVTLFGGLFYWSIFPFLNDELAAKICPACSHELTRYGYCPTCRQRIQKPD